MLLTDEQIAEICVDISQSTSCDIAYARAIESAVLEKLKAQEPFGYYENGRFSITVDGGPDKWRERKAYRGAIYTHPLPPADVVRVAELEAVLRECRKELNGVLNGKYSGNADRAIAKIDEVLK